MGTQQNIVDHREKPRSEIVLSASARKLASELRQPVVSVSVLQNCVKCIEFFASFIVVYFIFANFSDISMMDAVILAVFSSLSLTLSFEIANCYQLKNFKEPEHVLKYILFALLSFIVTGIIISFFISLPFVIFINLFILAICVLSVCIITLRYFISGLVSYWKAEGRLERRAILIGGGVNAENFLQRLHESGDSDIKICGIFDDRIDGRVPEMIEGYPHLGAVDELIEFARIAKLDMLIMTMPVSAQVRMLDLLKKLWVLPIDIRIAVQAEDTFFRAKSRSVVGDISLVDIAYKPLAEWDALTKRIFDIVFSLIGLCVFSPLLLITAILIRLDSQGPILFRQKRFGFNNEVISVLKFRSMYQDKCDPQAKKVVTKNDPRVTQVGQFIRRSSIDELPQLWNVLKGDLSLIGPRPHAVFAHTQNALWDEIVEGYYARHRVKPGVTGWAQINGFRGEIDTAEKLRRRVEHDLYYIENWSLSFDFYIAFMTPIRLFSSENSY